MSIVAVSTYYELLGIEPSADQEEVKAAYRTISTKVHPDVGGSAALFRQVRDAYETLSDPTLRSEYDRELNGRAGQRSRHEDADTGDSQPGPGPSANRSGSSRASGSSRSERSAGDGGSAGLRRVASDFLRHNPSAAVILGGWLTLAFSGFFGSIFLFFGWAVILVGVVGLIGRRRLNRWRVDLGAMPNHSPLRKFAAEFQAGFSRSRRGQ